MRRQLRRIPLFALQLPQRVRAADSVSAGTVNGRCGPGTRIPFLVISPWARSNYVDDTQITQASVVRFIEDNWLHGQRIGQGSNDATAGSIMGMFDFRRRPFDRAPRLFLDPATGLPVDKRWHWHI